MTKAGRAGVGSPCACSGQDSVTAYRNAIRLEGATAVQPVWRSAGHASGGIVSAEAQAAFEAALKLEPEP